MKKILILEDDKTMCKLYEHLLKRYGYEVTVVRTVEKAIEALTNNDAYDLYIIDLMLAGDRFSGAALIDLGISPVLIVSAIEFNEHEFEMTRYIRKPFKNDQLIDKIKEILNENYSRR